MTDIAPETPADVLEWGRRYIAARLAAKTFHRAAEREYAATGYQSNGPIRERWLALCREEALARQQLIQALNWRTAWFAVDEDLIRYDHNRWRKVYIEIRPRFTLLCRTRKEKAPESCDTLRGGNQQPV